MLELGVDEITLVLQMSPSLKDEYDNRSFDWGEVAGVLISQFEMKARFISVFGGRLEEERAPKGYTIAFKYGEHNFYFAVAFHPMHRNMGIVVKFSAQALDYYCERTGLKLYELLQMVIDEDYYTIRLSRIDLTCDYIDEDINPTEIYQDMMDGKIGIFREYIGKRPDEPIYRRCIMEYEGFIKGDEVPTIYIGSAQSNSQLRIYDKKREQIERKGTKYKKALNTKNWVRFEGVFRNEYAHQITEELLRIQTDDEFANLIACVLVQKFRLMKMDNGIVDCETDYTQMLIDCINNNSFSLKSPSSRNYELAKNVAYIFHGSGVMATLYKIRDIWGEEAVDKLLKFINDSVSGWKPNEDCQYWLQKNAKDYLMHYTTFDIFMKENVLQIFKEHSVQQMKYQFYKEFKIFD